MNGKIAPNRSQIALHWDLDVPLQELAAEAERQKSTIYYKYIKDDPDFISETNYESEELEGKTEWVSFKQQFFNSTLIARDKPFAAESRIETIESEQDSIVKYYKSSLDLEYQQLASEQYNMSFYFGPNHVPTLKKVGLQLDHIIPLGWILFRAVNEYAIIPLFNFLRSFISNYGLVILLLTLIVKLILLPLTYKSYKSTAKMKVLKPEIDKIKEKHKGDAQKAQVETMSLYRSFGVSPMGGCLPMILQMPILLSIFFFFPSSIELRQESFLWAQDLSRYDSVLELGFSIPFYGDHVSLFTILMTIATFLYTYMNNQVSGATGQMKYIGYIMPVFFLGFFNNYASGLTYYYFLSNMITFTQQWGIRKFFVDDDKIRAKMESFKKTKGKSKKGPSNFQKKLEDIAKKRGIDPKTGKRK
jgi:YidC/Oxa1 family membrane protein insertase